MQSPPITFDTRNSALYGSSCNPAVQDSQDITKAINKIEAIVSSYEDIHYAKLERQAFFFEHRAILIGENINSTCEQTIAANHAALLTRCAFNTFTSYLTVLNDRVSFVRLGKFNIHDANAIKISLKECIEATAKAKDSIQKLNALYSFT